jgi:hypothetical protein
MNRLGASFWLGVLLFSTYQIQAQPNHLPEIALISDTQEPLPVERLFHKTHRNPEATRLLMGDIARIRYGNLFMLGDVVSLGYQERKWKRMDRYLQNCRSAGTVIHALLGNHELMGRPKKGLRAFNRRFPDHIYTGYVEIVDSMAFVLLNSNFKHLSAAEIDRQQAFYAHTLESLNANPAVVSIVVACHHSPYSNSKTVGSSIPVQERFIPLFMQTLKCRLFVSGHAHVFEHFRKGGKDFLVIGGGGGIRQPLETRHPEHEDVSGSYKPMFHYMYLTRKGRDICLRSRFLADDFSGCEDGYGFTVKGKD